MRRRGGAVPRLVEGWLSRRDEPGQTTFAWQPLAVTADVAIVTGTTTYRQPPAVYSNLWVMRFDFDGRCREFTEWWMPDPAGGGPPTR